jgi:hypothetical protein
VLASFIPQADVCVPINETNTSASCQLAIQNASLPSATPACALLLSTYIAESETENVKLKHSKLQYEKRRTTKFSATT